MTPGGRELEAEAVHRWIVEAESATTSAQRTTDDPLIANQCHKARKELASARRRAAQLLEHHKAEAEDDGQGGLEL